MLPIKILVTGGAGYIGSHTVIELQQSGYDVVIIDDLSNSEVNIIDRITKITGVKPAFYPVDMRNYKALEDVFNREPNIFSTIHFAAFKAVEESVKNPLPYYQNNINSLLNLLNLSKKFNIKHLVFSSSCTVYGQPNKLPVTEQSPILKAESPYGNTKQICEEIMQDFYTARQDFSGIALRYFNPIGAHQSGLIGELPQGVPNNLIPLVTQTAAGLRGQLKIFGNDYNTPDGTCIRDYINVVDLAKAHVAAINRQLENKTKVPFEVFNLGTGKGVSVMEIIKEFENVTEKKVNYAIAPRRAGDIEQIYANTTLAEKELNWKAEKSLGETLSSAWEWEKKIRNIQ